MAIQVQGNGGVIAEVDGTTFRALRVTNRPINYGSLGFYRVGVISATIAAILGGGAELFQWRWVDATNLGLIYKLSCSAGANLAATAAGLVSFNATIARAWTVVGTGGTRLTMTGNNAKMRTSMGTSLVNDIGVATTAALGAGTKTLDATNIGAISIGIGTGAITTALNLNLLGASDGILFDGAIEGNQPIVCAQNEGVVIRNGTGAWPATMTWQFGAQCAWAEAAAF